MAGGGFGGVLLGRNGHEARRGQGVDEIWRGSGEGVEEGEEGEGGRKMVIEGLTLELIVQLTRLPLRSVTIGF